MTDTQTCSLYIKT